MTKTIIPADKPLLVWHFLRQNWETDSGYIKTKIGETYHVEPPIRICSHGLHGSRKVLDAIGYSNGTVLTLCEVWGEFDEQSDKIVAEYRRPLWGKDISPELAAAQAAARDVQQIDLESRMVELLPADLQTRYIESRKQ